MDSIVQGNLEYCPICFTKIVGQGHWHHIYPGANRNRSDSEKMLLYVHPECHMRIHNSPLLMLTLQARYQDKWCEINGKTVEDFMEIFGKDYKERLEYFKKNEWRDMK